MIHGTGKHRFRVVEGWGRGPAGREFGGVITCVAVDRQDRVYLTRRKPPAILVYDREGRFLASLGEKFLHNPHGIHVSDDGALFVTDSVDHTVRKLSLDGDLLLELGTPGQPGAPGRPFNKPTKAVTTQSGDILVSDGYGQCRVHWFSAGGTLLHSWGTRGTGDGELLLPHSVAVDRNGRVLVPDRSNHRIQIFDATGAFLSEWSGTCWGGFLWPNELYFDRDGSIYLAEADHRVSIWTDSEESDKPPVPSPKPRWKLLSRWGDMGTEPGQFAQTPHSLCLDSHGDLYVSEVPFVDGRLQKFERVIES